MRQTEIKPSLALSSVDFRLLALWLSLMFIGWLMIFASEYDESSFSSFFDLSTNNGKQLLFILGSVLIMVLVQFVNSKAWPFLGVGIYIVSLVLLFFVLFTTPVNGSTSWFRIGSFRFQPSELSKVGTALMLAYFLSQPGIKVMNFGSLLQAGVILALPVLLILFQGDVGSMLVYASFFIVLYRAGLSPWFFIVGILAFALSIATLISESPLLIIALVLAVLTAFLLRATNKDNRILLAYIALNALAFLFFEELVFWILGLLALGYGLLVAFQIKKNWALSLFSTLIFLGSAALISSVDYFVHNILKKHQQERIWVWLKPERCDPLGPLYNLDQSKHAIGSGGWFGKGFLEGERTKLDYVPEQSTDFIFCTIGEEWGFFGSLVVIGLYLGLLSYTIHIAERQRMLFARYYAYGVASILFVHVFINIGMTTGVVPVIGIPLPFLSYGGSSLWSFSFLLAILVKLDAHSSMSYR